MVKTINIEDDLWKKLMHIRVDEDFKNMTELINHLLKIKENKNNEKT